jgi:hypothetical protein
MYVNKKMIYVNTIPGMGEGSMKENIFEYIQYIVRTFVNSTMHPA